MRLILVQKREKEASFKKTITKVCDALLAPSAIGNGMLRRFLRRDEKNEQSLECGKILKVLARIISGKCTKIS